MWCKWGLLYKHTISRRKRQTVGWIWDLHTYLIVISALKINDIVCYPWYFGKIMINLTLKKYFALVYVMLVKLNVPVLEFEMACRFSLSVCSTSIIQRYYCSFFLTKSKILKLGLYKLYCLVWLQLYSFSPTTGYVDSHLSVTRQSVLMPNSSDSTSYISQICVNGTTGGPYRICQQTTTTGLKDG